MINFINSGQYETTNLPMLYYNFSIQKMDGLSWTYLKNYQVTHNDNGKYPAIWLTMQGAGVWAWWDTWKSCWLGWHKNDNLAG